MHIGKEEIPQFHLELVRDRTLPTKFVVGTYNTADILHSMLDTSPVEKFVVIYVNSDAHMVGAEVVAMGDLEHVAIGMRNIFRGALLAGVPRIIMGHNHPGGKATPSDPDLMLTALAIQVGQIVGIEIVDHVIVSPNGDHYSVWDHQEDMVARITQLAVKQQLDKLLGSNPFTDPFTKPPINAMDEMQKLLMEKLKNLPY